MFINNDKVISKTNNEVIIISSNHIILTLVIKRRNKKMKTVLEGDWDRFTFPRACKECVGEPPLCCLQAVQKFSGRNC